MSPTPFPPQDLVASQMLNLQLAKTVQEQAELIKAQREQLAEQQLQINELMRQRFAKRSERYLEDPNQLKLDFGNTPEAGDAAEGLADAIVEAGEEIGVEGYTRRKRAAKQPRNEQLPAHLPRREVPVEISSEVRCCPTHGERTLLGYDVVETLVFERPRMHVEVRRFPKFICPQQSECGVQSPVRPAGLVEGNRYDTSVAAQIITAKTGFHLPIYRQQDYFAGCGWTPSRSTLLNIAAAATELLPPFIDHLKNLVLASGRLGTDDTMVTLLLPAVLPEVIAGDAKSRRIHEVFAEAMKEGRKSITARMWAYRSLTVPLNIFDFTVSRHRDGPDAFLVDSQFVGKMIADCYTGYQGITLRSESRIERAACNVHARRKVLNASDNHPLLAARFLAMYRELYDIEDRGKLMCPEERLVLRQTEAQAVWMRLRALLDGPEAAAVLPKEKIAEALGYLRNHWDALRLYLADPLLPIDNNDVEQLMKQVAIGRRNWLFVGSVAAGERAANFLTLVSSALRNDLDVYAYMKAVLDALLAGSTDYEALRPDVWAQSHPEAIRQYRKDERRDRVDAKITRRAARRAAQQTSRGS